MEQEILVYVDLDRMPTRVGRLWARNRGGRESASFEYDRTWLHHPARFSLEPAPALGPGPYHTGEGLALFGALGDSAPDRWGRTLMLRRERHRAEHDGGPPRTLLEIDYLLMVDDETRQGALRFAEREGGPFFTAEAATRVPPLVSLPRLLQSSDRVLERSETDEDLRDLLAPGSSLGGARPKASVRTSDGTLAIAKFPRKDDEYDVVLWEAVALSLASAAGSTVPDWSLMKVDLKSVLVLDRFDRTEGRRIPFLSAMSMLGARDNQMRSYMEIADAIRQHGAEPAADMEELWRRMVFNILISNSDDHLRNHGFLYQGSEGWRLCPAYDLNPVPTDIRRRALSTSINGQDNTASLGLAMEAASYFGLSQERAREIARITGKGVGRWRSEARKVGILQADIDRMSSAFEHEDLEAALRL
jgi:serine/threonine-protein kinase HipA